MIRPPICHRGFPLRLRFDDRQGALDQAERPHVLAMPKTPADVFDRIGEARTVPAAAGRGVRPAAGALSGVLDAHRQVEPCVDGPWVQERQ